MKINIRIFEVENGFIVYEDINTKEAHYSPPKWVAGSVEELCLLIKSINMKNDLAKIAGKEALDDIPF